jgi:ureidoglycolate dehydrogenase (NAD+)
LAKRGLLAIAVCNGGPAAVIPFNGTKGIFGTNPIAYGIPGEKGQIYCVDMATSEIPYFELLNANKNKQQLRDHTAVDQNGEFTTDPSKALDFSKSKSDPDSNIVSIGGGYKGYYMTYLMEVITSALIGMPSGPEMHSDFMPEEHGSILLVFSPKAMGTDEEFKTSIKALHQAIKTQKPKAGETIRLPGEENNKKFKEATQQIEVDDTLVERLNKLSKMD